mmetsp:Transcript_25111/g.34606  ORF Transcript_25111/g.34606 Transcript_25111/m.34606 type:complete len:461 (+) Transcript_25111:168-1550(+)
MGGIASGQENLRGFGPGLGATKRKNVLSDAEMGVDHVGIGIKVTLEQLRSHLTSSESRDAGASLYRWSPGAILWTLLCLRSVVATIPVMEAVHYNLIFLYYQPLLCMVVMTWLWGLVLHTWSQLRINPSPLLVFELEDLRTHLTCFQVFQVALLLSVLLLTNFSMFTWACATQHFRLATLLPALAYFSPVFFLLMPFNCMYKRTRYFFLSTLGRLLFPIQPITFSDFFLADILTSLAKTISDSERAVCSMLAGPVLDAMQVLQPVGGVCGSASWHIPFWLALPYLCRFLQCIRQYFQTGDSLALANALKYTTTFPVILLSAMKYHVSREEWFTVYKPLWLTASVLNSAYSFYWDVTFDWDFSLLSRKIFTASRNIGLRGDLLYSPSGKTGTLFYYWVVVSDILLRITWTYKLSSHLRHNQMMSLLVSILEVFRRFQWIFFRVERQYFSLVKTHMLNISYN